MPYLGDLEIGSVFSDVVNYLIYHHVLAFRPSAQTTAFFLSGPMAERRLAFRAQPSDGKDLGSPRRHTAWDMGQDLSQRLRFKCRATVRLRLQAGRASKKLRNHNGCAGPIFDS